MNAPQSQRTLDDVRRYYGEVLSGSSDLKTGACCTAEAMPPALEGMTVLDLGCGTGRDVYLLSRLVGPQGRVIGIDMTTEQLAVAERHRYWHAERYGYAASNVQLHQGYIEDLAACGIADASVDVVVSNCVLNLSPEKSRVFAEIDRVLKPGGELYFSDVFADRRIPEALRRDPVPLFDADIEARIGMVAFRSITVRAFKLALEDRCEDYGQLATYRGSIAGLPHAFVLDDHHRFETGKPERVCGNTFDMLARSRFAAHFELAGDTSRHFGLFACASDVDAAVGAGSCC